MRSQFQALRFVLDRDLVSPRSVVAGDLLIVDASRRNRNYKFICKDGPSYLFKQGSTPEGNEMIAHEAAIYQFLHSIAEQDRLTPILPRIYLYDEGEGILILELLGQSEDMGERQIRLGRFSAALAAEFGRSLGWLHHQPGVEFKMASDRGQYSHPPPWVLSLHRPNPDVYRKTSSANLELIKIIQKFPGFGELLDELHAGWRPETLIHGDIKFANCAVVPGLSAARRPHLKIIDWESARPGDPCWDVGSVFSDYLATWIRSIPATGSIPPHRFPELARLPLGRMQPAMRSFWEAYIRRMELSKSKESEWRQRSVRYCAARLIQTTFELLQMETQLSGVAVIALQLCFNMLKQPSLAAAQLFGLSIS